VQHRPRAEPPSRLRDSVHQCAGRALARLEGAIAISRFLARFPDYALDREPVRGGRVRFRGFLSVPCTTG
jgi:cytochrome P450